MVSSTIKITEQEKLRYPRSIAFIISNEFCERFNYYGMRTILVLYLTNKLHYNEETSTVVFHMFTMLLYMFPLVGAIIADSWLGKYRTIVYLSILYAFGCVLMAMGAVPYLHLPQAAVTMIGLLLIAAGTGGIKPCVSAFGGDQFTLPKQAAELVKFFSLFYFAINAGSMISTTITPILRADVHCFGDNDCYSLAFGVPALLMVASVVIFVSGKSLYRMKPPEGNMIIGVTQCIAAAFKGWKSDHKKTPRSNFLDYATGAVDQNVLNDTRALFKVLVLYLSFPVFWALFDQQGSRWTFQATRMDGAVASWLYIKPDQMNVVNPLLILGFIPLFDYLVYPLLRHIGIKRPLQKLVLGAVFLAFAFVISAIVDLRLEAEEPIALTPTTAQLRLYNGMPCNYDFSAVALPAGVGNGTQLPADVLQPLSMWSHVVPHVNATRQYALTATSKDSSCATIAGNISVHAGRATSYFIADDQLHEFEDESVKPKHGQSLVRVLINTPLDEPSPPIVLQNALDVKTQLSGRNFSQLTAVTHGQVVLSIRDVNAANVLTRDGGVYAILVQGTGNDGYKSQVIEVIKPNTISVLWQLPQIVVITAAEIMFSVTGLEFSFTQAPSSMKSVLQACWLLTMAVGNLIVVVVAELKLFEKQSSEILFFVLLMVIDILILMMLAMRYTYVDQDANAEQNELDKQATNKRSDITMVMDSAVLNGIEHGGGGGGGNSVPNKTSNGQRHGVGNGAYENTES